MTSIVPHTPAEALNLSPECITVSNTYLELQNIPATAEHLGISAELVSQILSRREVKAYIDNVFMDMGYNNRHRIRGLLDAVINKKLEEMEEAGTGSSKDITEILALSHKVTMDILNAQIKLEEAKAKNVVRNQTNVQINTDSGSNYQALLDKLINNKK